ncbi:enoyl-CoA hydratase-related protein [Polaromonas sp. AET17H-212]|uniref:enoyl-CoA hydratase-related protein n=1 Tax=Polaromonas sp. AET17H-212 TaxID=1977061 RepID=UPI0015971011|nr:enoyl-CoA hydratase-related protein [Polaromonas sp. AET17H-212]
MNGETLQLEIKDNIACITLNCPETLNALSMRSLIDFHASLKQVIASHEVRALLITGTGRGFSSGVDLTAPRPGLNPDDPDELLRDYFAPTYQLLKDLRIPTVAAVNGVCAGAGVSLALSCDIVLAARSAYFVQAFVNLGLVPDTGASWLVTQAVGSARATGLMLLGEKLAAETAADWGLIWKCVDDDKLMQEASAIVNKLAVGPTTTYSLIKRLMRDAKNNSLRDQILLENECQSLARKTEDNAEARKAFAEKRKPVYNGR